MDEKSNTLKSWIFGNSYQLAAALTAAVFLAGVMFQTVESFEGSFRVIEHQIEELSDDIKNNAEEIDGIQKDRARDMAEIKTLLQLMNGNINSLIDGQKQRDKDIIEFYQKYDLVPKEN